MLLLSSMGSWITLKELKCRRRKRKCRKEKRRRRSHHHSNDDSADSDVSASDDL
ncbi:UNVERIFIED_CONTAM: hypothetical protein Sindi_0193600 [Sesamum indicum]